MTVVVGPISLGLGQRVVPTAVLGTDLLELAVRRLLGGVVDFEGVEVAEVALGLVQHVLLHGEVFAVSACSRLSEQRSTRAAPTRTTSGLGS